MKSLKKINLKSVSDTLVDREMKNILGGGGGDGSGYGGTCAAIAWTGDSWGTICNESKADVINWYDNWSGTKYWCCDSCQSTSWYQSECGA